jgi:hypothetical protein
MTADSKKPGQGDIQMKEAQQAKKDASGDVEMGDVDKKDDEKAEEKKEDPAVTTANGTPPHFCACTATVIILWRTLTFYRDQAELYTVGEGCYAVRCPIHPASSSVYSVAASQGHT